MAATDGLFFSQSFLKSDGSPYSGVRLSHYEPGGTVNKDVYSNAIKTLATAQPFVGDTSGRVAFYGDGEYRFLIQASVADGGATLYDWDPITLWNPTATLRSENQAISNPSAVAASRGRLFALVDGGGDVTAFRIQTTASVFAQMLFGNTSLTTQIQWGKGADLASSSTLTIGSDGNVFDVTGTTNVDALSTKPAGTIIVLRFTGAGLNLVHNATSLITFFGFDYRVIQNETITLMSLGSGNWQMIATSGPHESAGTLLPTGVAADGDIPSGYLICDGAAVSRTTYAGLFAAIASTWGNGDGSTTFNVPDLRGRLALGRDNMGASSANRVTASQADNVGQGAGAETHTLVTAEMPSHGHASAGAHTHDVDVNSVSGGTVDIAGSPNAADTNVANAANSAGSHTHPNAGGDGAHANVQPYGTVNYIVRF